MLRYLETFFRHKVLLSVPVVIALVISIALTAMQPRKYEASGNIWFDAQTTSPSAELAPNSQLSPAEQEVEVLKELLLTRDFSDKVGNRGPLAAYFAAHPYNSGSVTSTLSKALHKVGIGSSAPAPVGDQVFEALTTDVSVAATGPQVVDIAMTSTAPDVSAGTVQAIIDQFSDELLATRRDSAQSAVDYYQVRLKDAQQGVIDADKAITDYARAQKSSSSTPAAADAQLAELTRSDDLAHQHYDSVLASYDQANLDLLHVADRSGFRVIDKPLAPTAALGFTKKLISALLAGLFIGLVVLVLGLVLLTVIDTTARSAADVERELSMTVAGTVRDFQPHSRKTWRGYSVKKATRWSPQTR